MILSYFRWSGQVYSPLYSSTSCTSPVLSKTVQTVSKWLQNNRTLGAFDRTEMEIKTDLNYL